ncbi:hypothetical protein KKH27_10440 [bacterium]|nr:hypothetical protein [bacterium]MBU1983486.1 hypothetical protein [bacterium]
MGLRLAICTALSALLLLAGCTSPDDDNTPTGPSPQIVVSVEARPPTIPANGTSKLVVFTELRRGDQPVADSTQVILLNTIGVLQQGILYTRGGVALDTLVSDTAAGMGWIVAYSQGVRDSVEIFFVSTSG